MWRILIDSVAGTSHTRDGLPCQDYSLHTVVSARGTSILVVACADGAGSAIRAETGSRIACETAVREMVTQLIATESTTDECIRNAGEQARRELKHVAAASSLSPRDYACTLLLAILAPDESSFLQVGDGAIVVEQAGSFAPVFWPKTGEYHNTTYFATDEDYSEHVQTARYPERVDGVALLTDGLQMLALDFAKASAHHGFFSPFFIELRRTNLPDDLRIPFRSFLDSDSVNARTDDDKTLVVAVREPVENLP